MIEPVVVEVVLGYALLGGALRIGIRPDDLPLARLVRAGWVTVELRGPSGALGRAEGQLRAALARGRARVDGFVLVPTQGREIRAVFTIWPPGAQPSDQ